MIELDDPGRRSGRQDWEQAVAAVLTTMRRDATDPAHALDSQTLDGLRVPALAEPHAREAAGVGEFPYTRGVTPDADGWDARARLSAGAADAAQIALDELAAGSTSLWLTIADAQALDALPDVLAEVYLDLAPLAVQSTGEVAQGDCARCLVEVARSTDRALHPRTVLGVDPFSRALRTESAVRVDDVAALHQTASEAGVRALVVDATAAYDAGSTDVTELAFALAAGVETLRALDGAGVGTRDALAAMEFRLSATDEQFVTIAKLRAARQLWAAVTRASGADPTDGLMRVHAVTAAPMLTRYDPWTNLLRTTIAAFAAGVAGAESITVLPFDSALGEPDRLGRRMARNISRLLVEESHVAAVADPAGGSHAVEQLTDELAAAAWTAFERIEQSGGLRTALESGQIRESIAAERDARAGLVRRRRQPLTGVSEFPLLGEELLSRLPSDQHAGVRGWAEEFEQLRDQTPSLPVVLATIGPVADHTARATFATNLLTAGGVTVRPTGVTDDSAQAAEVVQETGSPVVVLAGSDEGYAASAAAYVPALRAAGASRVVLAGRPSEDVAALVDASFAAGDDVIEVVTPIRELLIRKAPS